jgi:hypothetical protein
MFRGSRPQQRVSAFSNASQATPAASNPRDAKLFDEVCFFTAATVAFLITRLATALAISWFLAA